MKILYAFNGTGYGHASRAMSILPLLKHYDVDILVSGEMNPIDIGQNIKYRLKGFTFVYNNGKLDYWRTFRQLNIFQFIKDILDQKIKIDYSIKEIDRVLIEQGEMTFIVPHFSNPYYYLFKIS
jgi:hypothetical protein